MGPPAPLARGSQSYGAAFAQCFPFDRFDLRRPKLDEGIDPLRPKRPWVAPALDCLTQRGGSCPKRRREQGRAYKEGGRLTQESQRATAEHRMRKVDVFAVVVGDPESEAARPGQRSQEHRFERIVRFRAGETAEVRRRVSMPMVARQCLFERE
jgi:hypothetical protein